MEWYEEIRKDLCDKLKQYAEDQNITTEQLSELSGFTKSNIHNMLNSKYNIPINNLIIVAEILGIKLTPVIMNEKTEIEDSLINPQFMFSIDPVNNQLYILHRRFPSCLIQVVQQTPLRFVVQDLYDEVENPADILYMDFVEKAKLFFREHAALFGNKN